MIKLLDSITIIITNIIITEVCYLNRMFKQYFDTSTKLYVRNIRDRKHMSFLSSR